MSASPSFNGEFKLFKEKSNLSIKRIESSQKWLKSNVMDNNQYFRINVEGKLPEIGNFFNELLTVYLDEVNGNRLDIPVVIIRKK